MRWHYCSEEDCILAHPRCFHRYCRTGALMLRKIKLGCTRFFGYRRNMEATTIDDDTGYSASTSSLSMWGKNCHLHHLPYYCSVGAPRDSHRSKSTPIQNKEVASVCMEQFLRRKLACHSYYRCLIAAVDSDHTATMKTPRLEYCSCCRSSCLTAADARKAARCYIAAIDVDGGTAFEAAVRLG